MNNKIESKIGALALRMSSSPILAITGVAALQADLIAKRIELLHELVPRVADVALLVDPSNRYTETELQALNDSARTLGLQLNGHSGKFLILKSFWEARRGTFDFERVT